MSHDTIWDKWDRSQLGSLHRRHEAIMAGNPTHDVILPQDLAAIIDSDQTCLPDELLRDYLLKALRGELKRPRGRPNVHVPGLLLEAVAQIIEEDAAGIAAARKSGAVKHSKADLQPAEAAADDVARVFRNISGRSLLNLISTHKKDVK